MKGLKNLTANKMASYNATNGYQKIIELICPFFYSEGFIFNILPYDEWGGCEVNEEFYIEKGWKNHDKRIIRDIWYDIEDDYDSYDFSGFFSRKNGENVELIQLSISTKKTVTLVYGIESPKINHKLHILANATTKVHRLSHPFATLYHDTVYSTWSGGMEDVDDVFLQYSSDRRMMKTIQYIKYLYTDLISNYFERGIDQGLLLDIQSCNSLDQDMLNKIGTIQREEFILFNYILGSQFGLESGFIFNDINAKIDLSELNDKVKEKLHLLNKLVLKNKSS